MLAGRLPDVLTDEDSAETNLFQPSIEVTKTASELSKVGDDVYVITIENTSSADSPNLVFDAIDDTLQGDLLGECPASLASGADCTIEYDRIVLAGDPDPLENTVTVETHPKASRMTSTTAPRRRRTCSSRASTSRRSARTSSKAGDVLDCTITIENTSSDDSPISRTGRSTTR